MYTDPRTPPPHPSAHSSYQTFTFTYWILARMQIFSLFLVQWVLYWNGIHRVTLWVASNQDLGCPSKTSHNDVKARWILWSGGWVPQTEYVWRTNDNDIHPLLAGMYWVYMAVNELHPSTVGTVSLPSHSRSLSYCNENSWLFIRRLKFVWHCDERSRRWNLKGKLNKYFYC